MDYSAGYLVSSILICAEYLWLGIFYRSEHRILFASFAIKSTFVVVEVALAIAFGVCGRHRSQRDAAAILEWGMSLDFCLNCLPSLTLHTDYDSYCLCFHGLHSLLRR